MPDLPNANPASRGAVIMDAPDKMAKVRDLFGIDSDMEVPAFSEADERDVGPLAGGHGSHVLDLDLPRDHLVSQRDHDRSDQRQPILTLVGNQDAQVVGLAVFHRPLQRKRV